MDPLCWRGKNSRRSGTFGIHEPNELEGKLLLGVEQAFGSDDERPIFGSAAISYALFDQRLGVGAETKIAAVSEEESGDEQCSLLVTLGPSVQWRLTDDIHTSTWRRSSASPARRRSSTRSWRSRSPGTAPTRTRSTPPDRFLEAVSGKHF